MSEMKQKTSDEIVAEIEAVEEAARIEAYNAAAERGLRKMRKLKERTEAAIKAAETALAKARADDEHAVMETDYMRRAIDDRTFGPDWEHTAAFTERFGHSGGPLQRKPFEEIDEDEDEEEDEDSEVPASKPYGSAGKIKFAERLINLKVGQRYRTVMGRVYQRMS